MKLIAVCIILVLATVHCVRAASVAVGLYAPDRYDGIPDMCLMPMDFGYCKAKVKRYYFDMRRMKCNTFYFGGCAGNINNFKTMEECNKVCLDSIEEPSNDANDANDDSNSNNIRNTKAGSKYKNNSYSARNSNNTTSNNNSSTYNNNNSNFKIPRNFNTQQQENNTNNDDYEN